MIKGKEKEKKMETKRARHGNIHIPRDDLFCAVPATTFDDKTDSQP